MVIRQSELFKRKFILQHSFSLTHLKSPFIKNYDMAQPLRLLASTTMMYDIGCRGFTINFINLLLAGAYRTLVWQILLRMFGWIIQYIFESVIRGTWLSMCLKNVFYESCNALTK